MADLKTCKYCGCSFKSGSGVNSKLLRVGFGLFVLLVLEQEYGLSIFKSIVLVNVSRMTEDR